MAPLLYPLAPPLVGSASVTLPHRLAWIDPVVWIQLPLRQRTTAATAGGMCMSEAAESTLARFAADAENVRDEEAALQREFSERMAQLSARRSKAEARSVLIGALVRAIAGADDIDAARANARVMLDGMALERGNGINRLDAATFTAFDPVVITIDNALNCEGEPDIEAIAIALARFEGWHEVNNGRPFFQPPDDRASLRSPSVVSGDKSGSDAAI